MQRRTFVRSAAWASLGAALPLFARATDERQTRIEVGLELVTVLAPMRADLLKALKEVNAIGYTEVETLGSLGKSPQEVQAVLAECHLSSPAQHLVPDDLYQVYQNWDLGELTLAQAIQRLRQGYELENIDRIIEQGIARAKLMGQGVLVWPVLFDEQIASRRALESLIDAFNRAGDLCRQSGLTFAFHNGGKAFERIGNEVAYDLILKYTDPTAVKMELDSYYAAKAGVSAHAYFADYPGRFRLMHLKDIDAQGQITELGKGTIDFRGLMRAARAAGVRHYFVEQDRARDPFGSARSAFDYVRHL